jgi:hypothetical protein
MATSDSRGLLAATAVSLLATTLVSPAAAAPSAKDRYIVVLKDSIRAPGAVARDHSDRYDARESVVYRTALQGYAATIPAGRVDAIRRDPRVKYVEHDRVMHALATQSGATWGLDRVDQRFRPLNGTYTYSATGNGVTAYILDTGIRASHAQFAGRVGTGFTAIDDGNGTGDCDGHGTHVAGTVGGSTYGVAKRVRLVPVRVLDCSGEGAISGIIEGVDWVTRNARKPAVANMSLGGNPSSALDQAVASSIATGVQYTIAAGNGNQGGKEQDACGESPARVGAAITVSASDSSDQKPSWANYGTCVDFFAPGVGITSAVHSSNTATATFSGTSMAAPHAAGAAALYLEANRLAGSQTVRDALYAAATKDIVVTSSSTPNNHLLYVAGFKAATPPSNSAAPAISGVAGTGQTLAGSTGTWSGTAPLSLSSQWQRCDGAGDSCASVAGATGSEYALSEADVGYTIRLSVTATNVAGSATAVSPVTAVVQVPPASTRSPELSASAYETGRKVRSTPGSWTGSTPLAFAYQWLLCDRRGADCGAIAGATTATYELDEADAGHTVRAVVAASNGAGQSAALSAPSAVVRLPPAEVSLELPKSRRLARRLRMRLELENAERFRVAIVLPGKRAERLGLTGGKRAVVGRLTRAAGDGRALRVRVRVPLERRFRRAMHEAGTPQKLRVRVKVRGVNGKVARAAQRLELRP